MKALFLPYAVAVRGSDGLLLWQRNLGSYLDGLAPLFDSVTVLCLIVESSDPTYSSEGVPIYSYRMTADNLYVTDIGGVAAPRSPWGKLGLLIRELRRAGFVYLFLPSYKSLAGALLARILRKPYAVYMGADWRDVSAFILPRAIPPFLRRASAAFVDTLERSAVRHAAFTLAHGDSLVARQKECSQRVFALVPILNWGSECFFYRDDTCQSETVRLLFVGTVSARKGIGYLIGGMAKAIEQGADIHLSIVGRGTGDAEREMHRLAKTLNVDRRMTFYGYLPQVDDVLAIYRRADIFVFPTIGEGFPRVIYEAMSQSLPVVTTSTGSIPAMLRNEHDALLVPARSDSAIAGAVIRIVHDRELRRKLIENGRAYCRSRFEGGSVDQFRAYFQCYVLHEGRTN